MCGIFAYVGKKEAVPVLLEGLTSLEYRGYDSAGISVPGSGTVKAAGAVDQLKAKGPERLKGASGIAHLRWATHGEPTERNAHPHSDCSGDISVVHNGIVENFRELKDRLISEGHAFASDTDTEVIAHLIEHNLKQSKDLESAVIASLHSIRGTYGLVVAYAKDPSKLIVARMGAPVVLGIGDGEHFAASDPSPILRHTKKVIYLKDGDVAVISAHAHDIRNLESTLMERDIETVDWSIDMAKKDGFEHFMMKEIMEGPEVIRNTIRGRLIPDQGMAKLGGLEAVADKLKTAKRFIVVGCGTAYYAGLTGTYMLEEYAGIPATAEIGSEFRYKKPIIDADTVLLAMSQSGETADTLEAIREAKRRGALTIGIVNAVGSTIARETDAGIYNHAGPEIGVASTKAFVSQVTALALLTLFLGRQRGMSEEAGKELAHEISLLPDKIEKILEQKELIRECAEKYADAEDFLYLGRKYNYAIAFEGALKLKEVSYLHAEGCGAGEMKHGPLAMIDEDFPTMAIAPSDSMYEKMMSNIQEIKARKGKVIVVATEGNASIEKLADDVFFIPKTLEMLTPILAVVPLQLFAYYAAVAKGLNVDRPRNLAKSVTVE
ncbi:MAG: glutamine--fructose-6-phosphate transaminase (isomerizing) [Candidatus Paceibacterota bacterium]|jgi:glucosamine--fructose-6-phosphate aminotransferase (isomerizing)